MPDIDYIITPSPSDPSVGEYAVSTNPRSATGNKAMSNRFQILLLTQNDGPLTQYGAGAQKALSIARTTQESAAVLQNACDNVVSIMKQDDQGTTDPKDKIVKAVVRSIAKKSDQVSATIELVPEIYDSDETLLSITFQGSI